MRNPVLLRLGDAQKLLTQPTFEVELAPGKSTIFKTRGYTIHENGDITWQGHIGDSKELHGFSVIDGSLSGILYLDSGRFVFYGLGDGYQILYDVDVSALPPEHDVIKRRAVGKKGKSPFPRLESISSGGGPYEIEVLLLYTGDVTANMSTIAARITSDFTTVIYNNDHGVNDNRELDFSVSVGHTAPAIGYTEDGTYASALDYLADTWAQNKHAAVGTDLILLIHSEDMNACGAANPDSPAYSAAEAYAVVAENCLTNDQTMVHEIGHIIGASHHIEAIVFEIPEYVPQDADFEYGHGFCDNESPYKFRTMMAINAAGCLFDRINYWSSTVDEHLNFYYDLNSTGENGDYQDVELLWSDRRATVAGWADKPPVVLSAEVEGPTYADYHEVYTLYGDADYYDPRGDSTGACTGCSFFWYERERGESWVYTSVTTENYLASMLSFDAMQYKLEVVDGSASAMDTVTVWYCDDCEPPKRGISSDEDIAVPEAVLLYSAYPNPFNPGTTITFALPEAAYVTIGIFDVLGKRIHTIVEDEFGAGYQEVTWTAPANIPSGTYIYRLETGGQVLSGKLVLLK